VATVDHSDVMSRAYERLNSGDVDGFGELVADDFVEHEELPVPASGKEGVLELFRMLRSAFPDMAMSVEDCIVSGNKAVARVRCTGTHKGEFMGIPASGQPTDMQLIDIMRIDDGLIREHWGVTDMLALMQQIGAVPTPG
jgi:steroid delta-isomerase-like uncharacterized protein